MKKILVALGIVAICLCSCNNNITNPELDEPTNETKTETPSTNSSLSDEKSNCLVKISVLDNSYSSVGYIVLNDLTIKDKNDKVVGTGKYWGNYYVPYDGTLTINWNHREYAGSNSNYNQWTTSEYTFNVQSAHELDVLICNYNDGICVVKIGGSTVAGFDHYDY